MFLAVVPASWRVAANGFDSIVADPKCYILPAPVNSLSASGFDRQASENPNTSPYAQTVTVVMFASGDCGTMSKINTDTGNRTIHACTRHP